jgi:hypothetical protein
MSSQPKKELSCSNYRGQRKEMKYLNKSFSVAVTNKDYDSIFKVYYHHRFGLVKVLKKSPFKKGIKRNVLIQPIQWNRQPVPNTEPIVVPWRSLRRKPKGDKK